MPTIFTRIIDGEIPGTFVWRDERCVVFMSINPMARGHALVVPIEEVDHWIDMPSDLLAHVMEVARTIGLAQREVFRPSRVGVLVVGDEVPHAHVHLIPFTSLAQLDLSGADTDPDPAALDDAAERLRAGLRAAGATGVPS